MNLNTGGIHENFYKPFLNILAFVHLDVNECFCRRYRTA